MEITNRFSKTLKVLLICTVFIFVFSLVLSAYGLYGISFDPLDNSTLRILLNKVYRVINIVIIWGAIGYLTKDYVASGVAFLVAILLSFGIPNSMFFGQTENIKTFLISLVRILPFFAFGLVHFKSSKGLYIGLVGLLLWGLAVGNNSYPFTRMLESFGKLFGVRDLFELKIPLEGNSYRSINLLSLFIGKFYLIVEVIFFWWVYKKLVEGKSIFKNLMTISLNPVVDKLTYSIIYWSLRLTLFITGLGILSYISRSFSAELNPFVLIRVGAYCFSLFVLATIYRNFLVSRFVANGRYPNGLFLFLNFPIVNFFAWFYSLFSFKNKPNTLTNEADVDEASLIKDLQKKFVTEGKNAIWKVLFVAFTFFVMIYQLNRAGFRVDGPSRGGAVMLALFFFLSFCLLLWFLADRNSYFPLLILISLNIVLVTILREQSLLQSTIATGIINLVLYFGLFHFNHLKWDLPPQEISEEEE